MTKLVRAIAGLCLLLVMGALQPARADHIRIGVLAMRGYDVALKMWTPTAEYLSTKLPGHSFTIVPLNLAEVNSAIKDGSVDFVLTTTGNYVELETRHGLTRMATLRNLRHGQPYTVFGAVIFTRVERADIKELADLRNKSFMAVDMNAFGGFQMAWRELKGRSIDPFRDFAKIQFSGFPQDLVVYAVRDGKVDAGTVRTDLLERMASEGTIDLRDFRILNPQETDGFPFAHSTQLYPEWPFAKLKTTPDELAQRVSLALLSMPPDSDAARAANGAGWAAPLSYHSVYQLMQELGIGPYKRYPLDDVHDFFSDYDYWLLSAALVLVCLLAALLFIRILRRRSRTSSPALKTRYLTIGFATLLAMMVGLMTIGLTNMQAMNQRLKTIVNERNVKMALATEMRDAIRQRIISLYSLLMLKDPFEKDEMWLKFNGHARDFILAREKLLAMDLSPMERDSLNDQIRPLQNAQAMADRVAELAIEEQYQEANALMLKARLANMAVLTHLTQMLKREEQVSLVAAEDAAHTFQLARLQVIVLGGAILVLGLLVARSVVRTTAGQARRLAAALDEINESNNLLEQRVRERTADLAVARDQALQASQAKSAFLANMSHELRTPLNAILGYSDILQEDARQLGHDEYLADLQRIHGAGRHLLTLIDGILDLSKIEAGKMDLRLETFDAAALVDDVAATVRPLIKSNGNGLQIECPRNVGTMYGDVTKVRQVLFNLLGNAAKFTENGAVCLKVSRVRQDDHDFIEFAVSDTGIGIEPQHMARLFQAFSQADTSTTRKYGGTGLGLAISKRYCALMGGDISVDSRPGLGSTFTVRLPVEVSANQHASNHPADGRESAVRHIDTQASSQLPYTRARKKHLV